jgi:hypothetical protein
LTSIKIIFLIAALYGLFCLYRMNNYFAIFILLLQISSIALVLKTSIVFISISLFLMSLSLLLIVIYAFIRKGFSLKKRLIIFLSGIIMFTLYLFRGMHWPGSAFIMILMIVPLVCYLMMIFDNQENYNNEIGFLSILAVDAGINFYGFVS